MNRRRLLAVMRKEVAQLLRDRRTLTTILLLPIIQLVLYGYLSNEVLHQPAIVWDQSVTAESRDFVQSFVNSRYFRILRAARNFADIEDALNAGRARVGIVIPPDFAEQLRRGVPTSVAVVVDAADATTARILTAASGGIGLRWSQDRLGFWLDHLGLRGHVPSTSLCEVRVRAWYNPNLQSQLFIVPGVLAIILQFVSTFLSLATIVRERDLGTLEQLVVTPVQRSELLLGKILPLILVGYVNLTFILVLAWLWFGVTVKGSLVMLYVLALAFFFSTLGLGTLISSVSRNFQQAVQLSQLILLPSMLLSGFLFPRDTLPTVLQWVGLALPLTHFVTVVRGIIVKGVGFTYLWPQILALVVLGAVVFGMALLSFQKKID